MDTHKLVPDVVDTVPKAKLSVEFGASRLDLGNVLTIEQVKDRPTKVSWNFDPAKRYVLCFTGNVVI
jgi:hypothetical protein